MERATASVVALSIPFTLKHMSHVMFKSPERDFQALEITAVFVGDESARSPEFKGIETFDSPNCFADKTSQQEALNSKGLRPRQRVLPRTVGWSARSPEFKGIETPVFQLDPFDSSSARSPEFKGIETSDIERVATLRQSARSPEFKGIETPSLAAFSGQRRSARSPEFKGIETSESIARSPNKAVSKKP